MISTSATMRSVLTGVVLLAVTAAVGCGGSGPAPPAAPPSPAEPTADPSAAGPTFDSLEYANWKRFPVGTMVRRKAVTSAEGAAGTTTTVETLTLQRVTDSEVVVERQNTTERSDGSYRAVNPPELRKFPRRFAIPNGMTADDFTKPARSAKPAGEETLTVLGKPYKTTLYTWQDSTEAGPMAVKLWLSDELPGRVAKQTMTVEKLKSTTVEEVIELKAP
jgi:hypothetical protein